LNQRDDVLLGSANEVEIAKCPRVGTGRDDLPRSALANEGLHQVYEDDVCWTVPLFASIEREGFHVDPNGLAADIATIVSEMNQTCTRTRSRFSGARWRTASFQ
jgi:hypothetical protein